MTEQRHGFFPFVTGDQVSVKKTGAGAIVANNTVQITQGGAQFMAPATASVFARAGAGSWGREAA